MKIAELVMNIPIWKSLEEQALLDCLDQPRALHSLKEREQTIAENLMRKNLLVIKLHGDITYVYKNV